MNKTEFISLIEHPEYAGKIELAETEKVISEFPYWQSVRLLYVKALHERQHFSYQSKLKLAAIYAGDRSKLFELINKSSNIRKTTITEPVNEVNNVAANYVEILEEENISSGNATVDSPAIVTENTTDDVAAVDSELINDQSLETEIESNNTSTEIPAEAIESSNDDSTTEIIGSDLNEIIEKRIKELTEQNNSYGTLEHDEIEPDISLEKSSLTEVEVFEIKSSIQPIDEDERVSDEEKLAAFDVYEETAIANDLLHIQPVEVSSTEVEDFRKAEEVPATTENEKSTLHSFLEWIKVLKRSEGEGESISVTIEKSYSERGRRSEEAEEQISSSNSDSHRETVDNEKNEIDNETESNLTAIIVSEESSTEKDDHTVPLGIGRSRSADTLNLKPETSSLIDKFIEAEPRIQPRKSAFFSPSTAARNSVMYHEDVVSETLAEIFYGQHLYDKAIKAYEKLTLMFPEKSTLFAARIQKIKEESLSGK